jgi:D-alanyl-lipoteichoic acid acyltransferase DltB (MBOAT superfamily)
MIIHSLTFAAFVLITLALYYLLEHRLQNILLLVASYIFYLTISWHFALILAITTAFNFGWAFMLGQSRHRRRISLWLGISFNIIVLLFFKYSDFFIPHIRLLIGQLGWPFQLELLPIVLPIGMSFYILQAISYLVDVYRNQCQPSDNPVHFALYLAYFPKITAGPIERAKKFLTQIKNRRIVDESQLSESLTLVMIGLVRKLVVADPLLASIPAGIFENPAAFSPTQLIAWMFAYTFALYNDFCGYTNIARGMSGFFGIKLTRNFAHPFFARNLTEIWNRWHISLSTWLRDYIYFPVSRAIVRRNPSRTNLFNIVLPPLVTMLISGFWHGRQAHFVVWGVLVGLLLMLERTINLVKPGLPPAKRPMWRQLGGMGTVLVAVFFSLIFFRMDIPVAFQFIRGLFNWSSVTLPDSRVFLLIIPALWIDWLQYRHKNEVIFRNWRLLPRAAILAAAIIAILLAAMPQTPQPFIYQGF